MSRGRDVLLPSVTDLLRGRGRRAARPSVHYLVSTAGHPNYGDELITRAWLDYLGQKRADDIVWLDCPHPGRASHLFADTHPNLRVTSTLWELAFSAPDARGDGVEARIRASVRDLGTPRVDPGLLALRGVDGIHVLGGGYLNKIWPANWGVLIAVSEYVRAFGRRAHMTGAGLHPHDTEDRTWLETVLQDFASVEVRDRPSAALAGTTLGLDDAFLALANPRPVWSSAESPEQMVLVQGDLRTWTDGDAVAAIDRFRGGARTGWLEAVPPDDIHYARMIDPDGRFFPFGEVWTNGLPARSGQRWLTSRYHVHLLAAATGAAGVVLSGRPGYYDVKHQSLIELGTGWNVVTIADAIEDDIEPTAAPDFPEIARRLAMEKSTLADSIYAP